MPTVSSRAAPIRAVFFLFRFAALRKVFTGLVFWVCVVQGHGLSWCSKVRCRPETRIEAAPRVSWAVGVGSRRAAIRYRRVPQHEGDRATCGGRSLRRDSSAGHTHTRVRSHRTVLFGTKRTVVGYYGLRE